MMPQIYRKAENGRWSIDSKEQILYVWFEVLIRDLHAGIFKSDFLLGKLEQPSNLIS